MFGSSPAKNLSKAAENKFVKSQKSTPVKEDVTGNPEVTETQNPKETSTEKAKTTPLPPVVVKSPTKPIIRESKLVLNQKLLERLRNPSHQVEFYQAIQKSMQSADKIPPKLVEGHASLINPGNFPFSYLLHIRTLIHDKSKCH